MLQHKLRSTQKPEISQATNLNKKGKAKATNLKKKWKAERIPEHTNRPDRSFKLAWTDTDTQQNVRSRPLNSLVVEDKYLRV